MWICSRCQTANKDGYAQCVQCSAPRNARRFGAGTPLNAPSVQAASGERRMQQPESREEPSSPRRHPNAQPHVKARRAPGGPVRLVGILLTIALPVLAVLLAVLRLDTLKPIITDLFWAPQTLSLADSAQLAPVASQGLRPILEWLAYGLCALLAALLAAAPGLSLWALGHLARGVRRI
jgi:hypothetical protein